MAAMSSLEDAANWLRTQVGLGGVFTKEALRAAFPNVTQIDRRVRDLRGFGWLIDTRREDPSLSASEMRLVKIGDMTGPTRGISPRDRRRAMLSAAYTCVLCGAVGGSTYPDAQHIRVTLQVIDAGEGRELVVCCARCRPDAESALNRGESHDLPQPILGAAELSSGDWAAACQERIARRLS